MYCVTKVRGLLKKEEQEEAKRKKMTSPEVSFLLKCFTEELPLLTVA